MAEDKAEPKSEAGAKQTAETSTLGDERYQYIGFEAFGAKPGKFWKSDTERQSYVEKVKEQVGSIYRNSVVYSSAISATDRVFIVIASLAMIVSPFLPWFSVKTIYGPESFTGLLGYFHRDGFWFYVQMMGGWVIPVSVYLLTAMALLSLVLGIFGLAAPFMKSKSEAAYVHRVKTLLRLNVIPFLVFLAIIFLGLVTQQIPFGEHLGVYDLGSRYSFVTLIQFSSYGFWLAVFGILLNFNKSREL
jgi:hypothetical protein